MSPSPSKRTGPYDCGMAYADWTVRQAGALVSEIVSARSLLDHGTRVLRDTFGTYDELTDPVLTTLSIGMEKLYKLTLGLTALHTTGDWPTKEQMVTGYDHRLAVMHEAVLKDCRDRATHPDVVALIAEVDTDPVVLPIIAALHDYGMSGRFYYLDQLGDPNGVSRQDPRALWQAIEDAIASSEPQLTQQWEKSRETGSEDALSHYIQARNRRTAASVERVRHLVQMCWMTGVLVNQVSSTRHCFFR